jgi:protein phosphatase
MKLSFPELSLVVLIGPSGSGKSTFASRHFKPTEVISSDSCRGLVSDDESELSATKDAFDVLHFIASKRLAAGKLTVVDATSVKPEDRKPLVALARQFHCLPVAIVFNIPDKICYERNAGRPDRDFGPHVIRQQSQQMRRSMKHLKREGFRHMFVLRSVEEIETVEMERTPLWNDRKSDHGPFDIIGDVHGCFEELVTLLENLGYFLKETEVETGHIKAHVHPDGRKAVFVGDLVDRGPRILDTIRLVRDMVRAGSAYALPGNHDMKLVKKLRGRDVQITHGLQNSLDELDSLASDAKDRVSKEVVEFLDSLVSHYVFDDGNLVVAHAGMREEMQGRGSGKVRDFALYGETTGETDEFGLPIRYNWASEYRGQARVVYGHTPVPEPEWLNRTINIDTGCVFGGRLTALRYPELELVSVPAGEVYCEPSRPFQEDVPLELTAQQRHDELLDLEDVIGKRLVQTRLRGNLTVREENAIAALEVMSRFAADPKWLIYLPPTMSPSDTSREEGMLEHPAEAFSYFRSEGIPVVICEEKHMGSRAIVIVARDSDAARRRFGVTTGESGICYTRTGRRFFDDPKLEEEFLDRIRNALDGTGFWDELQTDWLVLDSELMPWSAKAQELLRRQYAAVGAAARAGLGLAVSALRTTSQNGIDVSDVLPSYEVRLTDAERFVAAYRNYCWPVEGVDDLKLAPFHIMASEGAVHIDKDHTWHMQKIAEIAEAADGLLIPTQTKVVDVTEPASEAEASEWWAETTSRGGEGMVAKPLPFVARGRRGLVQPGVKCRGVEYLRIIYGPDYAEPANLDRLRARGLSGKRSLAIREFALGIEGLERFVRGEPLRRVHECAFGVLALESEPVDPRL